MSKIIQLLSNNANGVINDLIEGNMKGTILSMIKIIDNEIDTVLNTYDYDATCPKLPNIQLCQLEGWRKQLETALHKLHHKKVQWCRKKDTIYIQYQMKDEDPIVGCIHDGMITCGKHLSATSITDFLEYACKSLGHPCDTVYLEILFNDTVISYDDFAKKHQVMGIGRKKLIAIESIIRGI